MKLSADERLQSCRAGTKFLSPCTTWTRALVAAAWTGILRMNDLTSTGAASQRTDEFFRDAPLVMDVDSFRRAGHALVDAVADSLSTIPYGPVTRVESPDDIRALLGAYRPFPLNL